MDNLILYGFLIIIYLPIFALSIGVSIGFGFCMYKMIKDY